MKKIFTALMIISLLMTGCGDETNATLDLPEEYRLAEKISADKIDVDVCFDATTSCTAELE